jgi:thiamine phosphate synthase YjbQ (UPF0047 family)
MTSVEIPYSVAAALPSLTVFDITNDVAHELARGDRQDGIAYVSPEHEATLVRVNERESGFFADLEGLLGRLIPLEVTARERLVRFLLGARTEQIPFRHSRLCLGQWQRVLLVSFAGSESAGWTLTVVG